MPTRGPAAHVPPPDAHVDHIVVARVPPAETYPLRQRVLRPGRPAGAFRLPVDDDPRTATFAARDTETGEVVGTTVVYPEPCPWLPQGPEGPGGTGGPDRPDAWRLRGMATEPGLRSRGVGGRVLAAALDHVVAQGGGLVWCNARVPARRFYERAGFVTHGDPWDEPDIGPHVAMWLDLRPSERHGTSERHGPSEATERT